MARLWHILFFALWSVLPAALGDSPQPAPAAPPSTATASGAQPRVRQVAPHRYQVGAITIDAEARTVRCPGHVNMSEGGPIEVLACLPRGKVHESVFTLDVEPVDLQVALLLLGLKEGRNPSFNYRDDSPGAQKPPGDDTLIFVEWRKPADAGAVGELERRRAEEFLANVKPDGPIVQGTWVFLGSMVVNGRFGADYDGTLITTFHDPFAILELNLPVVNANPYRGQGLDYVVNKDLCPPVGTPVELVIQPLPKVAPRANAPEAKQPSDASRHLP